MNPVSTAVTAAVLVALGKWSRGQTLNVDNAIGVVGIAVCLAVLEQFDERMSAAFAVLILASLASVHLPAIVKALGF